MFYQETAVKVVFFWYPEIFYLIKFLNNYLMKLENIKVKQNKKTDFFIIKINLPNKSSNKLEIIKK